jgi:hypothetical protein
MKAVRGDAAHTAALPVQVLRGRIESAAMATVRMSQALVGLRIRIADRSHRPSLATDAFAESGFRANDSALPNDSCGRGASRRCPELQVRATWMCPTFARLGRLGAELGSADYDRGCERSHNFDRVIRVEPVVSGCASSSPTCR